MISKKRKSVIKDGSLSLLFLIAATVINSFFYKMKLMDANLLMVYVVCVLLTASMTEGFLYGILTSLSSMVAYNYFFVSPSYSLDVDNTSYIFQMSIMLLTSCITSMMTSRVKDNERKAKRRELEAAEMLHWTNQISEAESIRDVVSNAVRYTSQILNCNTSFLLTENDGSLNEQYLCQTDEGELELVPLLKREELNEAFSDMNSSEYRDCSEYRDWPIYGQSGLLGAFRFPLDAAVRMDSAQLRMFSSIKETTRLASDRLRVVKQQIKDNAIAERERYRATLLRSISHDLRTPLAGILGITEMLLDMGEETRARKDLVESIRQDAQWLYEMVENILSLTRLQDGKLIQKEPELCEEVIEAAVRRIRMRAGGRKIKVHMPEECLAASMDIKLIEQVLINMLDNAIKHTTEQGEISVSVWKQGDEAVFEVMDNGTGIREADLPNLFQLFYTSNGVNSDKKKGTGLGLAICEATITAHEGKICVRNREDTSGAVFQFTLPIEK